MFFNNTFVDDEDRRFPMKDNPLRALVAEKERLEKLVYSSRDYENNLQELVNIEEKISLLLKGEPSYIRK